MAPVPPGALEVNRGTSNNGAERSAYMTRLKSRIPPDASTVRRNSRLPADYFQNLKRNRNPSRSTRRQTTGGSVRTSEKREQPTRAGFCNVEGCRWGFQVPNRKCHNTLCYSYVHILCATENGFSSKENDDNLYCCEQCKAAVEPST